MMRFISLSLLAMALVSVGACTLLPVDNNTTPTPSLDSPTPVSQGGPTLIQKLVEVFIPVQARPTPIPPVTQTPRIVAAIIRTPTATITPTPTLTPTSTLTPTVIARAPTPTPTSPISTPGVPRPTQGLTITPSPTATPLPVEAPGEGGGGGTDDPGNPNIRFALLSSGGYSVNESSGTVTIAVRLNNIPGGFSEPVTVDYKTRANSAIANFDYGVVLPRQLKLLPPYDPITATLSIVNDALNEASETFFVDLLNHSNNVDLLVGNDTSTVTITDDDPLPSVRFNPTTYIEGEGSGLGTISMELFPRSGRNVTVFYDTNNGSAITEIPYQDYTTITPFGARIFTLDGMGMTANTTLTFTVSITDDLRDEFDETLELELLGADFATITGTNPATLTLIDNDPEPWLSIVNNVTVIENNTGTVDVVFPVTLSALSEKPITVTYSTTNSTAIAGNDYITTTGSLVFAPLETSQLITVPVLGDSTDEFVETFKVNLSSAVNATIAVASGTGTILDDDLEPTVSIIPASRIMTEGNSGITTTTFTVELSSASGKPIAVTYATADNTATAGGSFGDYTQISPTILNFAPGQSSQTITTTILGDTIFESDESFFVNLIAATNAITGVSQGTINITNDDTAPTLSIGNAIVTENDTGSTSTATFTVTLSKLSEPSVQVDYITTDNTAVAPGDYTAVTSTPLTFAAFEQTKTVTVIVQGDNTDEFDETFFVNLSNPVSATISISQGIGTILDNDPPPSLSISNATVTEGDIGSTQAVFTVTLSATSEKPITVTYTTTDSTAIAGNDYTSINTILVFPPLTTSRIITVPILGDTTDEFDETFRVDLSNPVNATIVVTSGTGTILDNDLEPTVSIIAPTVITVTEGNSGITTTTFTVELSSASEKPIAVTYATADNTATAAGLFGDYIQIPPTTLNFALGETSKTITATVRGDTVFESDERFFVNLIAVTNAITGVSQGTINITNDDTPPAISISDAAVTENNTGFTPTMVFTLTLSNLSDQSVQVDYSTANDTAIAPGDYTSVASTTLTFAPFEQTKTVTVTIQGDNTDEFDETFFVNLGNPVSSTIAIGQGIGTILNDEPLPELSISNATVTEGDIGSTQAVFTVTLSAISEKPITVTYATTDSTAIAGNDYTSINTILVFPPLTTSRIITVSILGDTTDEFDETFRVNLSSPVNATIAVASGTGTILDDDLEPTVSIIAPTVVTVNEGDSGGTNAVFTVELSAVSEKPIAVTYATADNSATAAGLFGDYIQ
ncbi:MAG: hypothetical protein GY938_18105, partial [Ketobacter sp.]|nr:hypothetical protein [Ketobacter sp.]